MYILSKLLVDEKFSFKNRVAFGVSTSMRIKMEAKQNPERNIWTEFSYSCDGSVSLGKK